MTLQSVTPEQARDLLAGGARLVDIREADEHGRERIAGAINAPLSSLERIESSGPLIFHCRSGGRTTLNADRLASAGEGEAYVLRGGIAAWKEAGLPVIRDRTQPIEIMRQVQIIAGSLVVLSILLGMVVAPGFLIIATFVGAGMIHAGVTGSCAMARLLAPLPWNRAAAQG